MGASSARSVVTSGCSRWDIDIRRSSSAGMSDMMASADTHVASRKWSPDKLSMMKMIWEAVLMGRTTKSAHRGVAALVTDGASLQECCALKIPLSLGVIWNPSKTCSKPARSAALPEKLKKNQHVVPGPQVFS